MGSLAAERVSGWRTALKLGRVSNVPTVWSNVIAGSALAGGASLRLTIAIAIAISLMYVAGMFLNDAFDRNVDAVERPERPIPAGEIAPEAVYVVGFSLLIVGMVALAAINDGAGLAGLTLGGAILLYNWHHKRNPVAPFVMGLCRALVYVVAAASTAAVSLTSAVLIPAVSMLAYVAGLTYTARLEHLGRIGSLWPLLLLAAPVGVALVRTDLSVPFVLALVGLAGCALRVAQLLHRRGPKDVSSAVGMLIAGIALNDALFASSTGATYAAYACLGCFALTLVLQRYVPAS